MNNEDFYATIQNQYGRLLGDGFGASPEAAMAAAHVRADKELASANPNWRWRKGKRHVSKNPFRDGHALSKAQTGKA